MGVWPLQLSFLVIWSTLLEYTVMGSSREFTGVSGSSYPISPCALSWFEGNDYLIGISDGVSK